MLTNERVRVLRPPPGLDPSGVPLELDEATAPRDAPIAGLAAGTLLASVTHVEWPSEREWLVWGVADGRTILFRVEPTLAHDFASQLEAGEEPTALVEPGQLVAAELVTR